MQFNNSDTMLLLSMLRKKRGVVTPNVLLSWCTQNTDHRKKLTGHLQMLIHDKHICRAPRPGGGGDTVKLTPQGEAHHKQLMEDCFFAYLNTMRKKVHVHEIAAYFKVPVPVGDAVLWQLEAKGRVVCWRDESGEGVRTWEIAPPITPRDVSTC
jgi:hypothetical protein